MSLLKLAKRAALQVGRSVGAFSLALDSEWRHRRLLILCYHGISLRDEHLWDPRLYMSQEVFRGRLEMLRRHDCAVLRLEDAVRQLYAGTLPPRSVVITFDDGAYDFVDRALPLLEQFGYPVTVYLSTHYALRKRPVFDVMCRYILWRSQGATLRGRGLLDGCDFDLSTPALCEEAGYEIRRRATDMRLDSTEKDRLAASLARSLGVDYEELVSARVLQLMRPDEVASCAARGVDFQLHTHRHRTPMTREDFLSEVEENRTHIRAMTGGATLRHFAYPSGFHRPEFDPWLRELGVVSATTCVNGIASAGMSPFELPRLSDGQRLPTLEFEGWLSGVSALLPHRGQDVESGARM
ncbi:MAG: polysaccharide deacetylase family protein [Gemmatimonadota bacterium]|nr:polysaccharide deacetylase family protein [Gemmatimonadota bacterium]